MKDDLPKFGNNLTELTQHLQPSGKQNAEHPFLLYLVYRLGEGAKCSSKTVKSIIVPI